MSSRRRAVVIFLVSAVICGGSLVVAISLDVGARAQSRQEQRALRSAKAHLAQLRREAVRTSATKGEVTAGRNKIRSSLHLTLGQLFDVTTALQSATTTALVQGADINILDACLGGIENALGAMKTANDVQATQDIAAVTTACTQVDGGSSSGLVYPYNFADPDVLLAGSTYYAYSTNSVSGNIQVIKSTNLTDWSAVGDALPQLPSWASALYTWHPSVAFIGGKYDLYYAADPTGSPTDCISVATSSSPTGPFVDDSTAPLECQSTLGGSIDPDAFINTDNSVYLWWKSGQAGSAKIWAQQLAPSGTTFAPGSSPVMVLSPDQPWETGNIEAPDLVAANGRYLLFYSGNNWDSANYAVGVASCTGPLGPCTDLSPNPILGSGPGVSGPGAESVFADTNGNFWIAFDGWEPNAVGGANNRALYVRSLNLTGLPSVGGPP